MKGPRRSRRFTENSGLHSSELYVQSPYGTARFEFITRLSARQRRTVLVTLYRAIKPVLRSIRSTRLTDYGHLPDFRRDERRGIYLPKSGEISSKNFYRGFYYRMKRIELGLTQMELARRSGVSRMQISRIERGLHTPQLVTLRRLGKAMGEASGRPY